MAENAQIIPIFPLNTVLLPGVALPLHIFEERYKEMVATCLAGSGRFGVVLIHQGTEVGAPAVPCKVGTIARIAGVDRLPNGRLNIVCVGEQRFQILEAVGGRPYQQARVDYLPDRDEQCEVELLAGQVREQLRGFLTTVKTEADEAIARLPKDPAELANVVAASLPVELSERQALLEEPSTCARLRRIVALLRSESLLLRAIGGARFVVERPSPFSAN